jgi:hypothetical protein
LHNERMLKQLNSSDLGRILFCCLGVAASFFVIGRNCVATDVKFETLLSDLHAPRAVAVRPDSSGSPTEIFVAENGAGRVVSWSDAKKNSADEQIAGLPTGGRPGHSESAASGVRALFFLDRNRLATAGGEEDDTPFLWLFDLSDTDASLKAEDRKQEVATPELKDAPKATSYVGLARTLTNDRVADLLYALCAAADGPDGFRKIPLHANTLGESALPVPLAPLQEWNATGGITISNEGYIVVSCRGSDGSSGSCSIRYLSPLDSRTVLEVPTTLQNVTALAFAPKSGNLFAANSSSGDADGGIYRIDDASQPGRPLTKTVKIVSVDGPTSMAFGPDGTLYATALGKTDGEKTSGVLLKLSGDF